MDPLLKLLNMFNAAPNMLYKYVLQNKEGLSAILRHIWNLLVNLNGWVANVLGVDIQKIINVFIAFFAELIKKLVERI